MGKRTEGVAATRRRILEAAVQLYREQGLAVTSMADVARRADVAPGTVLNHYRNPDMLARAVGDLIREELRVPGPELLDGLETLERRIRRLSRELAAFYDRSESWYEIYRAEAGRVGAWDEMSRAFFEEMDRLIRAALGPLADDDGAVAVVATLLNPGVSGGLRWRGLAGNQAADILADLLIPWLERRSSEAAARGDRPPSGVHGRRAH